MPSWTKSDYDDWKRRSANQRTRPCAVVQELENDCAGPAHHEPEAAKVDGELHPRFRVTVTLYVSDNRRRDADGALSTIMDCVIAARRRLLAVGAAGVDCGGEGGEGAGGGNSND